MQAAKTAHPMVLIAAGAVTLFCGTGIAALMGWLPHSGGTPRSEPALVAQAPVPVAETPKPETLPAPKAAEPQDPPAAKKQRPKPVAKPVPVSNAPETPPVIAKVEPLPPAPPASIPEPPQPVVIAPQPKPVYRPCPECAIVESVRQIAEPGSGTGVGAIGGAVAGGVLGHQVGNGRGKDVATVLGAIGGAIAGHQVERHVRKTASYEIEVRFEDGTTRTFTQPTEPVWRAGDKVKVVNGVIRSATGS